MILEEGGITQNVIEAFPGHCVQFMQKAQGLVNHVKVLKAEEEEAAHWAEMWERSQIWRIFCKMMIWLINITGNRTNRFICSTQKHRL